MELLVPSFYLGPIAYYSAIQGQPIVVEQYEFYVKQSYRNRCCILGANGKLNLIIPMVHQGHKVTMKDQKICNDNNWQKIHWKSIVSAYRTSSYFEYYEDDFKVFYEKTYASLLELNTELHLLICRLLKNTPSPLRYTETYQAAPKDLKDLRQAFPAKEIIETKPYHQVFGSEHGYLPNLSIIDLLFNHGPASLQYL